MAQQASIDDYIAGFPPEEQAVLQKIRKIIQNTAPESVETISYGMPAFKLGSTYLIYFAGWKDHIALYPIPTGDADLQKALSPHVTGKGTLQFRLDQPIPYDLIKRIVIARLDNSRAERQHHHASNSD